MKDIPVILTIAGSDCSGGAGIQADIKTISALGGYAASAITAITIQNTVGVREVHPLPPETVAAQIEAVAEDLSPVAIKMGMVANADIVHNLSKALRRHPVPFIVYDPVMVSTSGRRLMTDEAIAAIEQELLPQATLITPNLDEAGVLTGQSVRSLDDMHAAAEILAQRYHTHVLIKGGHLDGDRMCDLLYTPSAQSFIYEETKIESNNLHGTGCTLSSAIAVFLAKGHPLCDAVACAKKYITQAILAGRELHIGHGKGPLWHFPCHSTE